MNDGPYIFTCPIDLCVQLALARRTTIPFDRFGYQVHPDDIVFFYEPVIKPTGRDQEPLPVNVTNADVSCGTGFEARLRGTTLRRAQLIRVD
jgi:hypothetical protein